MRAPLGGCVRGLLVTARRLWREGSAAAAELCLRHDRLPACLTRPLGASDSGGDTACAICGGGHQRVCILVQDKAEPDRRRDEEQDEDPAEGDRRPILEERVQETVDSRQDHERRQWRKRMVEKAEPGTARRQLGGRPTAAARDMLVFVA